MKYEENMARLEEIVANLENGNLPLEETVKLFEEGMKLSLECQTILENAEQKIKMLEEIEREEADT